MLDDWSAQAPTELPFLSTFKASAVSTIVELSTNLFEGRHVNFQTEQNN